MRVDWKSLSRDIAFLATLSSPIRAGFEEGLGRTLQKERLDSGVHDKVGFVDPENVTQHVSPSKGMHPQQSVGVPHCNLTAQISNTRH